MTTLELLRGVRELLAVPERWTKKAFARTATGTICNDTQDVAVAWCIRGAAYRLGLGHDEFCSSMLYSPNDLSRWNDAPERTHAEVLARLDAAIEREVARG